MRDEKEKREDISKMAAGSAAQQMCLLSKMHFKAEKQLHWTIEIVRKGKQPSGGEYQGKTFEYTALDSEEEKTTERKIQFKITTLLYR